MAYVLALLSAAFYGAADFLGGLASRAAATVAVVFVTQASGLLVLAALLPLLSDVSPAARDLSWGLAAGLTGSVGVALLYRALAIGTMAIVAPTTAVCAVVIPVMAGVLLGERPAAHTIAGIGVALVAIVLVSQQRSPGSAAAAAGGDFALPPGLGLALIAGVAIGFFFLALAQTGADAGLWPLVAARGLSLVLFGAIALWRKKAAAVDRSAGLGMSRRVFGIAVAGGILDMLANALYVIAVREGPLTAVVTLSSLYPASTVLLARILLHERLRALQTVGIAAALVAVVLIVT